MYEIFQGYEAFARAGYIAAKTSRAAINVGTINPYTRHPAVVGMGANFLSTFTKGRASVLVGYGNPSWVGKVLGYERVRPRERTEEFVGILRQLFKGEEVTHRSKNFVLDRVKLAPGPEYKIPIIMAAIQPPTLELAGRIADGAFLQPDCCTTGFIKRAARIAKSQCKNDGFKVIASMPLVITKDLEKARASIKPLLAFHLSHPAEGKMHFEEAGYPVSLSDEIGEASGVRRLLREGRNPVAVFETDALNKAGELVPDDYVDQCSVIGDLDTCKDRLKELERAGLTDVVFSFPYDAKDELAILGRP